MTQRRTTRRTTDHTDASGTGPGVGRAATGGPSDVWVTYYEVAATILIALGVLLDMLAARGYLPDAPLLRWLEDSFFVFQIPVYYLAFGYVYQRTWRVDDGRAWLRCMGRQLIVCLTPFLSITLATLVVDGALGEAPLSWGRLASDLFSSPVSPVGFYPILLLMYALTPTIRSMRGGVLLLAFSLALKIVAVATPMTGVPYVVSGLCGSWLWFCIGMVFGRRVALEAGDPVLAARPAVEPTTLSRMLGTSRLAGVDPVRGNHLILGALWLGCSLLAVALGFEGEPAAEAVITLLGLLWSMAVFATVFGAGRTCRLFASLGKVTIGVFLLHPICLGVMFHCMRLPSFAAALDGVGAARPWLATALALAAAYLAPTAILWVLDHVWKLGFLLKPSRYLPAVRQR